MPYFFTHIVFFIPILNFFQVFHHNYHPPIISPFPQTLLYQIIYQFTFILETSFPEHSTLQLCLDSVTSPLHSSSPGGFPHSLLGWHFYFLDLRSFAFLVLSLILHQNIFKKVPKRTWESFSECLHVLR